MRGPDDVARHPQHRFDLDGIPAHHYNLVEMCVAPDRQRSGIGSALFGELLAELAREGVEKVFLLTAPAGPAAAFYAKFGFTASHGRVVLMSPKLGA